MNWRLGSVGVGQRAVIGNDALALHSARSVMQAKRTGSIATTLTVSGI